MRQSQVSELQAVTSVRVSNRALSAPKVLLTNTNRWPAPARLAVGLARAGCAVSAVCPKQGHPILETRALREAFPYDGFRPIESLAVAIEKAKPDLVIPCDDLSVQHLHALHSRAVAEGAGGRDLAQLIERSLGSSESFSTVSSRFNLLQIAKEEGVPVPATERLDSLEDVRAMSSRMGLPFVLKADGTWGGRGVRFAETTAEAEQEFLELTSPVRTKELLKQVIFNRDRSWFLAQKNHPRPSVVAQRCIGGRPANCAVFCWKGEILAGISVEVISSDGVKGPAFIVRVVEGTEMMFAARQIAGRLGLSGFFGLDFMIENGSGEVYLIEMNPRCTPLCHLQLGNKHDLIGALWAQVTGQPHRITPSLTERDMIAYFPQAWNSGSEFLNASYHDVPEGEPELLNALLHPWPERSLMGRLVDHLRKVSRRKSEPSACIFSDALKTAPSRRAPAVAPSQVLP